MRAPTRPEFSAALMEDARRWQFNPLPGLKPETLTGQIDQFRAGSLRALAMTMECIEERDDLLASVVPKAKAAPGRHGWEILTVETVSEGERARAAAQKERLNAFYNNFRVSHALDGDLLGDVQVLLQQMMDAKGKRYAVHNLVWTRVGGAYTAEAVFVPLYFFEARTGRLRFCRMPGQFDGDEMKRGAWLVTVGAGVMIACAIAYMFKRLPMRDWLVYSLRHGLPLTEVVTAAKSGSPEWRDAERLAASLSGGDTKVVRNKAMEVIQTAVSGAGELPYPALVDRMNRSMAAIWRGADLGTISSGEGAEGRGANLQGDEADVVEEGDRQWLQGQVNMRLDRLVLDFTFGEDEPALAYFALKKELKRDVALDLRIDEFAMRNGHPIGREQFAERYARPLPDEGDEVLRSEEYEGGKVGRYEGEEAGLPRRSPGGRRREDGDRMAVNEGIEDAQAAALAPLVDRLERIFMLPEEERVVAAQTALAELPGMMREIFADEDLAAAWEAELRGAVATAIGGSRGGAEDAEEEQAEGGGLRAVNAGFNRGQLRDGNGLWTRFLAADKGGGEDGGGSGGGNTEALEREGEDPGNKVGQTGDWNSLGLPSVTAMSPDVAAPEMSVEDARAKLQSSYTVNTPLDDYAEFGPGVLRHWEEKGKTALDVENRLRFLAQAEAAVSRPHEIWENPRTGTRTFIHVTRGPSKSRTAHVWELKGGQIESYISTSDMLRKGNKHREGRLLYVR